MAKRKGHETEKASKEEPMASIPEWERAYAEALKRTGFGGCADEPPRYAPAKDTIKAAGDGATAAPRRKRHRWVNERSGNRRCSVCGLRLGYQFIAPGAGGRAVQVEGEDSWWIIRRLPPCPTTADTELEIGFAK